MNPESAYKGNGEEAMYCAMQVVGAGSDTTRQALNVFIMAMIEHPEVFAKVRAEVDSVCKGDGGPSDARYRRYQKLALYRSDTERSVALEADFFTLA
jgi:cytochrome P450